MTKAITSWLKRHITLLGWLMAIAGLLALIEPLYWAGYLILVWRLARRIVKSRFGQWCLK